MRELIRARQTAFRRQGGLCCYCGFPMWEIPPGELASLLGWSERETSLLQCTAEHLIPKSKGGSDAPENIVAACKYCNATRHKSAKPLSADAFSRYVQQRIAKGAWHNAGRSRIHILRSARAFHADGLNAGMPYDDDVGGPLYVEEYDELDVEIIRASPPCKASPANSSTSPSSKPSPSPSPPSCSS